MRQECYYLNDMQQGYDTIKGIWPITMTPTFTNIDLLPFTFSFKIYDNVMLGYNGTQTNQVGEELGGGGIWVL